MKIETLYDSATSTLTYVVWDEATGDAVVIDPVLDFDPLAVQVASDSVDRIVEVVQREGLTVHWVLETHAHADHISGSQVLRERLGAKVAIGERITTVQEVFGGLFNRPDVVDGAGAFDRLLTDGEVLEAGSLAVHTRATPGHTPACVTFHIGDALFTGDTLFMPDFGTGRCDFPSGSAEQLYDSVMRLYALPDDTRVFVGHDYQPAGRPLAWETTIGDSKASNVQLSGETSKADFVAFRTARDATLRPPRLLFQSI